MTGQAALADARIAGQELAAGLSRGPLHGVPVGIKDLIATQGTRTTAGSRILGQWIPRRDAAAVWMLRVAGAILVGKTNTHEFAFGTTNDNPHYGAVRNPWNPSLTSGGSSGGSAAAVAAGLLDVGARHRHRRVHKDPGGAVRSGGTEADVRPDLHQGVVPLSKTLDTVGPLGRTVDDVARAMEAFPGSGTVFPGPRAPGPGPRLQGLTIGVPERYVYAGVDAEVENGVREALRAMEAAGAVVRLLDIPELERCWEVGISIVRPEALAFHKRWYPERAADYGEDVARSLEAAKDIPASTYLAARRTRRQIARALRRALEDVDLLAGPTVPILAFPNGDAYRPVLPGGELPRHAVTRLTYPFSLSRLPAISVPCGLSKARLPIGLQLAAGPRQEAQLLAAARAFEEIRGAWPEPPTSFRPSA